MPYINSINYQHSSLIKLDPGGIHPFSASVRIKSRALLPCLTISPICENLNSLERNVLYLFCYCPGFTELNVKFILESRFLI